MGYDLSNLRNIGISAHIDSGKTTLSERILYYAGRIHKISEVKGKDGVGATMDYMDLEKEKGITITSASTQVQWNGKKINLIDTPGHVDFTIEVERSLRVLDGAILVLCGVGGVQSQTLTVDRQMKRYQTPRLAFINKLDRTGANPFNVVKQIREKLNLNPVMMQIPVGAESNLQGVIDLIEMQAVYFDGEKGDDIRREAIPADLAAQAKEYRALMLEEISRFDEDLMGELLEGKEPDVAKLHKTIRRIVINKDIVPVYMGSAYKNKGVQLLLDAVVRYLPSPLDRQIFAKDLRNGAAEVPLAADPEAPLACMAFKIIQEPFGQLTYVRIYQGKIRKGEQYLNSRMQRRQRFSRILRMHANDREDIEEAGAGDIVAVIGIDCASGDTYCSEDKEYALESIFVPEPVIKQAIAAAKRQDQDKLTKALDRFRREDPTFHVMTDKETNEILIAGMGELHLEIYTERIKREYGVDVVVTPPKVSYREAPTQRVDYDYKHKKQTGGSGQYAHIKGYFEPLPEDVAEPYQFEDKIFGGRIAAEYVPAVDKGFQAMRVKGPLAGFEVCGIKCVLEDGSMHSVDSSEMAFKVAAQDCFREYFLKTKPVLLEPIMKVEIECPTEFQGSVVGDLNRRRGVVLGTDDRTNFVVINAEVPLAEMFGYSTDVRSMTQGKAGFTMEFLKYRRVPNNVQEEVVKKAKAAEAAKAGK
jgi:elongation factor G